MTLFWTLFIGAITVATLIGCAWLLILCTRPVKGINDGEEMGHEFDGIKELNNPLPTWWRYLFWATLIFAALYLLFYPGIGAFSGLFHWQSSDQRVTSAAAPITNARVIDQYARESERAKVQFDAVFKQLAYDAGGTSLLAVPTIATNPEAIQVGQRLFMQNCAQCHGLDARGKPGFPNLIDQDWLYGGTPAAIKESINNGRIANMPSWQASFDEQGIKELSSYVLSLSGRKVDMAEAARGQAKFSLCVGCHGVDGKGNMTFGAPNLTDNIWLYGGSRQAVEHSIRNGRQGVMPAWQHLLDEGKIQLVVAYIWHNSQLNKE